MLKYIVRHKIVTFAQFQSIGGKSFFCYPKWIAYDILFVQNVSGEPYITKMTQLVEQREIESRN